MSEKEIEVKVGLSKQKSLKGRIRRLILNYYCLKKSLSLDVPEAKIEKVLFKAYKLDMEVAK